VLLKKVWVRPLSTTYLSGGALPGFILGFGRPPFNDIRKALLHLRSLTKLE
jgi:DNA-binding transcriptional MocR family regulator